MKSKLIVSLAFLALVGCGRDSSRDGVPPSAKPEWNLGNMSVASDVAERYWQNGGSEILDPIYGSHHVIECARDQIISIYTPAEVEAAVRENNPESVANLTMVSFVEACISKYKK